jgi:hypothetical protein
MFKNDTAEVNLFQSKLCSFLCCELKATTTKAGNITLTPGFLKITLVWTLNDNSLLYHMAKVHVMGLGRKLKRFL